MTLSTTIMKPRRKKIRAVVCYCHGYTDHVSFAKRIEFQRLCDAGLAFVAIEYEGHGRSDGALGLINDWEDLVHDVASYYTHIVSKDFAQYPIFLMGESMGGAVAYSVYNRIPSLFKGVVFICPMCKISEDMLPHPYVIALLKWRVGPSGCPTNLLGYLPLAPVKNDLACLTHRIAEKALQNAQCPFNYGRNPRLATARELIDVTQRIGASLSDFTAPFLVLHGTEDRVTDPQLSQALYNEATSTDKSIRLYEGMWHSLTCGESDANIDLVFRDVIGWILARV
jgi:alpha-beta hydrolase superfamily lysophospholipase